ncbi:uncharacterized protein LOC129582066 [Paramacrobiotus metropolitanus]|uniref:uncharacterized protein LOC129582066 n=1 Tax=Paramacrobiotus metropolitanus TaxID=2943436 RepID=UPI002445EE67|nr:uncharacterized protein LOC129582066 [Paramacrobiotus metropolitanus]
MAVRLVSALLAAYFLVVLFAACAERNERLQIRNGSVRSAAAVRFNPTLDIRVMHYYYDGNCDPEFWNSRKCDPHFTITYSWVNTEGITRTQSQTHSGGEDVVEINFPVRVRLTRPVQRNSTATVRIVVVDKDFTFNDDIGNFFFDFSIPGGPGNYIPTTVTKHLSNGARMSVEFSVRF